MSPLLPEHPIGHDYINEGHANAKKLLTNDFFWDPGDDYSPIGGDTGSDALAEFWEWRGSNPTSSVMSFLEQLIEEFGVGTALEFVANGNPEVAIGEHHLKANVFDELVIAVAFAQFMKDGSVEKNVHRLALRAVNRQSNASVIQYRSAEPSEQERHLVMISQALDQMDVYLL